MSALNGKPVIMMCPPVYFEPAPPDPRYGFANAFEEAGREKFLKNPQSFRQLAKIQSLRTSLSFAPHADIVFLPPQEEMPDEIYTTDPSLTLRLPSKNNGARVVTILGNFSNEKRAPEIALHKKFLKSLNDGREIIECPYPFEAGDCVYDPYRRMIWAGYTDHPSPSNVQGGRTSLEAHNFIREKTGVKLVSVKTSAPYYHADTVLAPLSLGHVIAHHRDLHSESHATFVKEAFDRYALDPEQYLITVSDEDAKAFASNLHAFGTNIVMPECSGELKERITAAGYKVKTVGVEAFIAGGGAVHCISNLISGYECDLER